MGKRSETGNGRKSEGRESNSRIEGAERLIESKEGIFFSRKKIRRWFIDSLEMLLQMKSHSLQEGRGVVKRKKKTYVIFPNSAINNKLLSLSILRPISLPLLLERNKFATSTFLKT